MMKLISGLLMPLLLLVLTNGCYYDNEEELYPQTTQCDTTAVTYSLAIAPIMQQFCNTCHSAGAPSGGVVTDNYQGLSVVANNGILWKAVNHETGATPMPQGGNKLSDCNLLKIKKWIDQGSPNN